MTAVAEKYRELQGAANNKLRRLQETTVVRVGTATCGLAAGAQIVSQVFAQEIQKRGIDALVVETGCMGHCYAEPLVVISKPGLPSLCYGQVDEGLAMRLVEDFLINSDPCFEYALAALEPNDFFPSFSDFPRGIREQKIILGHCGLLDPSDIDQYIAAGGYAALAEAIRLEPGEIIKRVSAANLRGRGGAGFPAGQKMEKCARSSVPVKYVICNADEGDPGAFMDRGILESNPHLVIEGIAIAARAVGAREGYFYIRAEYPRAIVQVEQALLQARGKGLLGQAILGSNFDFECKVFAGSGAFVCGEGTALVSSMEGRLGTPRHKPPRLTARGFRGCPTLLQNVKTLCYLPGIISKGVDWFKSTGTPGSPGTAVFALAGKINRPGMVEVPMGTTLRQLVFDVGEGIPSGKRFKAVQIGGPSGGCLGEAALDIPIDFDSLHQAGAMMGSGGLVVLDEDDCMVAVARYFLEFTTHESCGKCTFCRLGTKQMLCILEDITAGKGDMALLKILLELAEDVRDGSLCNLGATAPNPVLTTLRHFRAEYEAHILEKRCPSLMCKDLVSYHILPEKCSKLCSVCVGSCPVEAVYTRQDGIKAIDRIKCVKCDNCLKTCPPEYHAVVKLSPPVPPEERGAKH